MDQAISLRFCILHCTNDQKLDGEKDWEQSYSEAILQAYFEVQAHEFSFQLQIQVNPP